MCRGARVGPPAQTLKPRASPDSLIMRKTSASIRVSLISCVVWPFHKPVADHLNQFGKCLVIDAHSFPSRALPYEDENLVRPDICFGYDVFHQPMELLEVLESICMDEGLTTAHNQPFSGSYVPTDYYRSDRRIHSLMIEVNRSLWGVLQHAKVGSRRKV